MSHSVHRLHMASFKYIDGRMDLYGYLIIADSDVLLIDTGIGEGNDHIESRYEPCRTPVVNELARFELEVTDVTLVINSHLHFDHCGNNSLFRKADILVQSDELSVARTLGTKYTVPWWFDYDGARLNPVSGDMEISAGIRLVSSPGHTPGHQSVLVETAHGNVLIAAQAAFTADEYQRGGDPQDQAHQGLEDLYLESISKLKSMAANEVYFSHDATSVSLTEG